MATSMLGTLGLGVSSEDSPDKQEMAIGGFTTVLRLGVCFLLLGAGVLYGSRLTSPVKRKQATASGASASIHGLQVDPAFFGTSALVDVKGLIFCLLTLRAMALKDSI